MVFGQGCVKVSEVGVLGGTELLAGALCLFYSPRSSHVLQVDRTTLKTKITIPETVRQDKGDYKLVAANRFGKAQHVVRVEILGKERNLKASFRLESRLHI